MIGVLFVAACIVIPTVIGAAWQHWFPTAWDAPMPDDYAVEHYFPVKGRRGRIVGWEKPTYDDVETARPSKWDGDRITTWR